MAIEDEKDEWEELIRSDLYPYNVSVPFHSIPFSNTFLGGPRYGKLLLYIKDKMGYYYENFKDHHIVGTYCLELFLDDKAKYKEYIKFWHSEFEKLNSLFKTVRNTDLSKLSAMQLADLLDDVYNKVIRWHGIAYNVDSIDVVLMPIIQKMIEDSYPGQKKSRLSEIYSKITFPETLSYINRIQLEKLALFRHMQEHGVDASKGEAVEFIEKYYWVNFKFGESKEYTLEDIMGEFKDYKDKDIAKELTHTEEMLKRSMLEKAEILGEISKHWSVKGYMVIFEDYAIFHDLRKEGQVKSVYFLRKIYNELASRLGVDKEQLYYLWPNEMIEIGRGQKTLDIGLLENRSKDWFCEYYNTAEWKEYFGEEALKMRDDAIGVMGDALQKEFEGVVASHGRAVGPAKICLSADIANQKIVEGDILVTGMTMPEFVTAMKKSAAIVTDEGGITCHAAIIAREFGIPCVVGTKVATRLIKDGDIIEVNANHGVIKIISSFSKDK